MYPQSTYSLQYLAGQRGYSAAVDPRRVAYITKVEWGEAVVFPWRRCCSGGAPMWKAETRRIYDRKGLRYPTDMTDAEWDLARPFVEVPQRGSGRQRRVVLREVLNAVFYILGTGCQWRALPKDLPPRSTVHDYFVRWQCDGTLGCLHHALYEQAREMVGKEASPTTAIVDSQSVKGAERGDARSIRWAMMRPRRSKGASATRLWTPSA